MARTASSNENGDHDGIAAGYEPSQSRPQVIVAAPGSSAACSVGDVQTAIIVLGNGGRRRGERPITDACLALVREGERVAASREADVVVLTGGSRGGRLSEGEPMYAAWSGPD